MAKESHEFVAKELYEFVAKESYESKIGNALMNHIIVDDVVTSGATLKEAAKVLKKAGVEKVWGITLAHGL